MRTYWGWYNLWVVGELVNPNKNNQLTINVGFVPQTNHLMAFDETSGTLTDQSKPAAERTALLALMVGALSSYNNPHSHMKVQLGAEEACEMIILASHLLKIVEVRQVDTAEAVTP